MEKEEFNPEFLLVPRMTMKLPVADRFVFGAVYVYCQLSKKKCTASNAEIGRVAGVHSGTVANSLVRLEEAGLIKRTFKDEAKKHRESIVSLLGFGKLDSSQTTSLIHPRINLDSSTNEQIKNTIKNIDTPQAKPVENNFSSSDYFKGLLKSSDGALAIIAYYTLKRKNHENVSSAAQAQQVIRRNIKVANRLKVFERDKIIRAIDECESTIIRGQPMFYSLETVEKFLLK